MAAGEKAFNLSDIAIPSCMAGSLAHVLGGDRLLVFAENQSKGQASPVLPPCAKAV